MRTPNNKKSDVVDRRTRVAKLSILSLVVCNLIVILWAVVAKWSFVAVMWVYWTQSVGIGVVWLFRVFSLKNFVIGDDRGRESHRSEPTFRYKTGVVCAVVCVYSCMHAFYAGFLQSFREPVDVAPIVIAGLLFFAGQFLSFLKEEKIDKERPPYLQSLNLALFIRVLPMHVVVLVSDRLNLSTGPLSENTYGMVVLLLVKTVVDVLTYAMLEEGWVYESIQSILVKGMPQAQKALFGSPKPTFNNKVLCRCAEFDQLEGKDAHNYARGHLKVLLIDGPARTLYVCPKTNKQWVLDSTALPDGNDKEYSRLRVLKTQDNKPDD